MDRRQFLKSMAAILGAAALPAAVIEAARVDDARLAVMGRPVEREIVLMRMWIGDLYVNLQAAVFIPKGATPEIVFLPGSMILNVNDVPIFVISTQSQQQAAGEQNYFHVEWIEYDLGAAGEVYHNVMGPIRGQKTLS